MFWDAPNTALANSCDVDILHLIVLEIIESNRLLLFLQSCVLLRCDPDNSIQEGRCN